MYQLKHSLDTVRGIGESWQKALAKKNIHTILDFLLYLPLHYENRSRIFSIAQLKRFNNSIIIDQAPTATGNQTQKDYQSKQDFFTLIIQVKDFRQYYKGRLLISRATLADDSGELPAIWFNNKFLKSKLKKNQYYYASGQFKNNSLVQANLEAMTTDSPHTARLVPIYSQINPFKQGSLRRLQKEIIDHLNPREKIFNHQQTSNHHQIFHNPQHFFQALHFPQTSQEIIQAREQLALEEIIFLINKAKQLKKTWEASNLAPSIDLQQKPLIPESLPFTLTKAQEKALSEITNDLKKTTAMNRLLIGDVGSGKTAVAAIAAWHSCLAGHNAVLVAPTQILAQQHYQTIQKLLPKQKLHLVTAQTSKNFKKDSASIYVGTHALINKLEEIEPALIIYDEQHRFGTKQRQNPQAHLLTMTATPIPRSLMLTIFTHLQTSILDEMPANRQMAKTWLVPKAKEEDAIVWLAEQLLQSKDQQAFIVCPFIDPSQHSALENVAAVKDSQQQLEIVLNKYYQDKQIAKSQQLKTAVLHSRLKKVEQQQVIEQLYHKDIQILVSTPMIEVGIDLPNADFIIIQAAERFGLASLHQLRGRVGRLGQKSFCLLFSTQAPNAQSSSTSTDKSKTQSTSQERLEIFCREKDGFKLAQLDLKQRGAGDIFGSAQSGFNKLQFASWTNLEIIKEAKKITEKNQQYQSILTPYFEKKEFLTAINNN
jgi:ATP-dependent DNA helicase RecG